MKDTSHTMSARMMPITPLHASTRSRAVKFRRMRIRSRKATSVLRMITAYSDEIRSRGMTIVRTRLEKVNPTISSPRMKGKTRTTGSNAPRSTSSVHTIGWSLVRTRAIGRD